ncbi:MAG: hypothetical protein EOO17_02940 [Chloroflexi bacterium]|nr:MAG: hypothetical protein EOO17_02940 [Chloroflexota bacterium]
MAVWVWIIAAIVLLFGFVVFRGAPYVPTRRKDIVRAFEELYPLSESDTLVDIGSGDGIVLRAAAARGAHAIGYELNPILVVVSRLLSRTDDKVSVRLADFWNVSLPEQTTIVYTFGESRDINKMYKKIEAEASRLQKPLFFMSFGFPVKGREVVSPDRSFFLYEIIPSSD